MVQTPASQVSSAMFGQPMMRMVEDNWIDVDGIGLRLVKWRMPQRRTAATRGPSTTPFSLWKRLGAGPRLALRRPEQAAPRHIPGPYPPVGQIQEGNLLHAAHLGHQLHRSDLQATQKVPSVRDHPRGGIIHFVERMHLVGNLNGATARCSLQRS